MSLIHIPSAQAEIRDLQRAVNELIRMRERERILPQSNTIKVNELPGGTLLEVLLGISGSAFELDMFRVDAVHRDHLECKKATYNDLGTNGLSVTGDTVRIAKPDEIRVHRWDTTGFGSLVTINGYHYEYVAGGVNPDASQNPYIQRTATIIDATAEFGADQVSFTETVQPEYIVGMSVIFAAKTKQSPIFTVTETVDSIATDYPISWVDLNCVAPRRFEPKYRKVPVCLQDRSGAWFVLVRTSDAFQES